MRVEKDALGEMELPDQALYGLGSWRAHLNFPISGQQVHGSLIHSYLLLRKAAALANLGAAAIDHNHDGTYLKKNLHKIALLKWYDVNVNTSFAVGDGPRGIAFDGANIWVNHSYVGGVRKLDAATGATLGSYATGGGYGIAFETQCDFEQFKNIRDIFNDQDGTICLRHVRYCSLIRDAEQVRVFLRWKLFPFSIETILPDSSCHPFRVSTC